MGSSPPWAKESKDLGGWSFVPISRIEDLRDAVHGAGLEAVQMSPAPVTGSLVFADHRGVTYTSGHIGGRVALSGPLSRTMITLGIGLNIAPGSRHRLNEVRTGDIGVFLAGDDHDALYAAGSLYATCTLSAERLQATADRMGLVLDPLTLGHTGVHARRLPDDVVERLRLRFEMLHAGLSIEETSVERTGDLLLETAVRHLASPPATSRGSAGVHGHSRIVARARDYILHNLEKPLSIDAIALAAVTSRRTLHRSFVTVLDETPYTYVQKLRLHRIRKDITEAAEPECSISLVASRWGIHEFGRLAGWYRDHFGELPSSTRSQARAHVIGTNSKLARSA